MNTQKKYNELDAQLQGRNRNGRKIANNTYAERRGEAIAIRLHSTDILTFNPDGSTVVNSGGWRTVTTKARLNDYLPNGYGISQSKGLWYWHKYNGQFESLPLYNDGDSITPTGELVTKAKPADEAKAIKFRKRVNAYAKLCADSLPLAEPGLGDCLYCQMTADTGESLGDAFKDVSHIELHMKEKYVVPSLVFRAMKERGWTTDKIPFAAAFGKADFMLDVAKREVKSAVARYIFKRYAMAYK